MQWTLLGFSRFGTYLRFVCYYQKILLNERGGGHEKPSPSPPATLLSHSLSKASRSEGYSFQEAK